MNRLIKNKNIYKVLPLLVITLLIFAGSCKDNPQSSTGESSYTIGEVLLSDDFSGDLSNWIAEGRQPEIVNGQMRLDAITYSAVWLRSSLLGNVLIEYDITILDQSVSSDLPGRLGCFAMATDPANPKNFFAGNEERTGNFSIYNNLNLYYIELGCNENTTAKLMRYDNGQQKLLGENTDSSYRIVGNGKYHIQLLFFGETIEFYLNDKRLFHCKDPELYTQGHFGLITAANGIVFDNFKITHLYQP